MSALICPVDGVRLVLVTTTNPQSDPISRWECPLGDWAGPWYGGDPSGENEPLPELQRDTIQVFTAGAAGGTLVQIHPAEWTELATATNATATATRAAAPALRHYITGYAASFDTVPAANILVEIRQGATPVYHSFVNEEKDVPFTHPIQITVNTAVSLVLGSGGSGITGRITLLGYSAP